MSGFKFQNISSTLNQPESEVIIVDIANHLCSTQAVKPDLEDDQKRWIIVGICLHRIISPALRQYVPPVVKSLYNALKQTDHIDKQTFAKHMKRYKPTNQELNYEAVNNNNTVPRVQGKKDIRNYNYNITNDVDLTQLFLVTSMAHYTGFDDTCDSSALLNIIINIDKFSPLVQNVAKKIRGDIRNTWAHCNFTEWGVIRYQNSFQLMQQLVRNLQLQRHDEAAILAELQRWETNGVQFLQGTTLGIELVQELKKETVAICKYILELSSRTHDNFNDVHQALLLVESSLKEAIDKVRGIEQESFVIKADVNRLSTRLDDMQKEQNDYFEQTKVEVKKVQSGVNDSKLKTEDIFDKVGNMERTLDDIQSVVTKTRTELHGTETVTIYTKTEVENTKAEVTNMKKELKDAVADIDRNKSELRKTIADVAKSKNDIYEITKYFSSFRPKEKIFFYPPDRIAAFISREEELKQLHREFNKTKSEYHVQVLCGLGGIGKTTLALEYSWLFQNFYPGGVFWMSAETNEALEDSVRRLAIDTYTDSKDTKETTLKTLQWLSYLQERWLLVIDNVDMVEIRGTMKELLVGAWKRNSKGHIIITSRREAKEAEEDFSIQSKDCIILDKLSNTESVKFLTVRSGAQNDMSDDTIELLAEELGGLPLALEQAAAHIKSLKCTFNEYFDKFIRKRLKLLRASRSSFQISKERMAVQTTWQLNFDYIDKQSQEEGLGSTALSVMEIAAFLYADEIPLNIFNAGSPEVCDKDLVECFQEGLGIKQVAEILVRFSLFQYCSGGALNVHRLVQEVIRENLTDPDHKALILQSATRMVNKALGETQSPKDALNGENIGRTSLQMWSKLALNANTLKTYLFQFTNLSDNHKDTCFNIETTKLLQASAVYHSLFQRHDEALACQDQMLSIIPAIGISESDCKDLTCIKIPLLIKDRQIIQSSITMTVGRNLTTGSDKKDAVALLDPESLRKTGNDAFRAMKYQDAIQYYSEAVNYSEGKVDTRILANRSLAYLKIYDYEHALRDADRCIQIDPKSYKSYCWKAYAIANLIRLGLLEPSWESAGLAAAAVAGFLNNKCFMEYKMKVYYPVTRYKVIEKESDLGNEIASMTNRTYTTFLLRTGHYQIATEKGQATTKSIQIIGIEEGVEIHSPLAVVLVRPMSTHFKIEDEINVYFENVTFPPQTGQISVSAHVNAVFYRCCFSNGKKGCESFPFCKGGDGCANSNPNECRVVSLINENKSCPQASGVSGDPGICAHDGGKVLVDNCILDRCGGGGTLSVNGSSLWIKNSLIRNMRQMGIEARNGGLTVVENCTISDNQFHGVAIGPKGRGEVRNCIIENNKSEGIWCGGHLESKNNSWLTSTSNSEGGSTCLVVGNLIFQSGESGISLDGGSYDISGNRIFENWLWGMMVKSRSTANICNNDIFENKCGGIRIGINYSSRTFINGNTVRDHTGPAIHTETSMENLVIKGDEEELMKRDGMLDDERTQYTLPPIITNRNVLENNNKGQQHPREILNLIETCSFCHRAPKNLQKCAKCRKASYCSKKCQKEHWKRHKNICNLIQKNFIIDILIADTTPLDENMPKLRNAPLPGLGEGQPPDRSSGKRFIVKIQSGSEYTRYDPNKEMRLYDQSQTFDIHFRNPSICNLVYECGVLAAMTFTTKKIFCWASFKDNGKVLCIHTENLPPFQTW